MMKKLVKKVVALAAVAAMGLSMIACGKKFSSVADYVKSDEVQTIINETVATLDGSGLSFDMVVDGDKLIYQYTYEMEEIDGLAESLESGIEAQADTFQQAADELKELVKADNPTVVVKYVDVNGKEIYSKEFPAK